MRSRSTSAVAVEYLTLVLLGLALIFAAVAIVQMVAGGGPDDIPVTATATLADDRLPKGVYPTGEQQTTIVIDDANRRERRLAAAIHLLPLLLFSAVLGLVLGIARSVRDGDPFVAANVRRLRAIGGLLILGVLAVHFAHGALQDELLAAYLRPASEFDATGLRPPDGEFPDFAPLCGLGVLVLAQVFAHGSQLREDVAGTI